MRNPTEGIGIEANEWCEEYGLNVNGIECNEKHWARETKFSWIFLIIHKGRSAEAGVPRKF